MKNIIYRHLFSCLIFFIAPACKGMGTFTADEFQKEDTDEFRKYVLNKAAYESLKTLTEKVENIIADGYRSIDTLTDREQHYLLCTWKNRQEKNEPISYTEEVFFSRLENLVKQAYLTYPENLSDEEKDETSTKIRTASPPKINLTDSETSCTTQNIFTTQAKENTSPKNNLPTILMDFLMDTPEIFRQKYGPSSDSDPIPEITNSQEAEGFSPESLL